MQKTFYALIAFIISTFVTTTTAKCPKDFVSYENRTCIFYEGHDVDDIVWSDARIGCRRRGMSTLAAIDDQKQEAWMVNKWMDRRMTSRHRQTAWFGLIEDGYAESRWKWDDPTSTSNYRHWNPGEPKNFQKRENCGMIIFVRHRNGSTWYGWNDAICEPKMGTAYGTASGYFCRAPYQEDRIVKLRSNVTKKSQ